jgi:hypothetical protein
VPCSKRAANDEGRRRDDGLADESRDAQRGVHFSKRRGERALSHDHPPRYLYLSLCSSRHVPSQHRMLTSNVSIMSRRAVSAPLLALPSASLGIFICKDTL